MESKQMITAIISLAVCTVMIVAFAVPVLGSLGGGNGGSGGGETYQNPAPDLRYAYAEGTIPDFSIDFSLDNTAMYVGPQIYMPDVSSIDPTSPTSMYIVLIPIYMDQHVIIAYVEGFGALVFDRDNQLSVASAGMGGTVSSSDGVITVTFTQPGLYLPDSYTFDAPSWCYYADANGEYGRYNITHLEEGVYLSDMPICPFAVYRDAVQGENEWDKYTIYLYNDYYATGEVQLSLSVQTTTEDGKTTDIHWVGDGYDFKALSFILPLEVTTGSGSGSGASDTIMTLVYVIPLLMIAGLVVATISMVRKS